MTDQHPITPPPELVEEWIAQVWHEGTPVQVSASDLHLASKAAEWGARYGHQPAPAAEGEVRGLVAELRSTASGLESQSYPQTAALITRAADLLEQRHPAPVPVPVSERLPAMVTDGLRVAGDCDKQGRCWAGTRAFVDTSGDRDIDYPPSWELREVCAQDDVWLPAHALPLPAVEVEG